MKVLLYAVFKVRGLPIGPQSDVRTLKAEQCSPDERSIRNDRLAGDPRARAAQPKLKNFGLVALHPRLSRYGRANP